MTTNHGTGRLIVALITLVFAGYAQFLHPAVFGAYPDLVLVTLGVAFVLLRDIWDDLLLLTIASFLLKFSPRAEREIAAFFIAGILALIGARKLPWHSFIGTLASIAGFTGMFYLLADPGALKSGSFFLEVIYNILAGGVLYGVATRFRSFQTNH